MAMTDRDDDLEEYFAAARKSDPIPGDDLMQRVMADAAGLQTVTQLPPRATRDPWWTRAIETIGGWPAMGGVMAAGVAGLWVGVAPPAGVEDWAATLVGNTESVAIFVDSQTLGLEVSDG